MDTEYTNFTKNKSKYKEIWKFKVFKVVNNNDGSIFIANFIFIFSSNIILSYANKRKLVSNSFIFIY